MNASESQGKSFFSPFRIRLAVSIGVLLSVFVLFRGLTHIEYRNTQSGTGTHKWVDFNHNSRIDFSNSEEFVASKNGDFVQQQPIDVFSEIEWNGRLFFWLILALFGMLGRDLAYIWRIRLLTKKQLSFQKSGRVILLWEFASALAPGVVSGAAVAMFILNRERISMGRSTAIVILTAFFDNLFYVVMIPVAFLLLHANQIFPQTANNSNPVEIIFWSGFSVFTCLCLVLYLGIFQFPTVIKKVLNWVTSFSFLKRWNAKANQTGEDITQTAGLFKKESVRFWITVFIATMSSWISRFLVINCILQAFLNLGLVEQLQVLTKQLVMWMFLRVSPTPGGSGVAEWAFGELLSQFSSSIILLSGMAIIWRLMSYYPYLFIGAFLLPRWLRKTEGEQKF